jgi:hypothetical protein
MKQLAIKGTKSETKIFTEVQSHYSMSLKDLEQRIYRRNGFDDSDKLFASYLDEGSWPYKSLIFDPRPYTVILEKSARLIGSKPKGRLIPREGGDTLGAYINNELLDFEWEDNARLGQSMIQKWIIMDQNARKYGSSFALCKWRWERKNVKDEKGDLKKETFYDGPDFTVLNNRDVLANPSYEYINKWFQHREYLTIKDMQNVNDASRGEPSYKNLDILAESVKAESKGRSDYRDIYSKNKSMRGLQDMLGQDEYNKVIRVVTEYRQDRWITFAPNHGVILRDISNPYKHSEIPVVHLKYYPIPDDLYGVSELEPTVKQIKAINAHISAYSDTIALALRPPVHVNPMNVRMHTLNWDPEAKWLMNNPNVDVQQMRIDTSVSNNFQSIYTTLVGSFMNAVGEQSQQMSAINPSQDQSRVTATEINATNYTRNVRDNMNKIFLSEALKRQIMLWHVMNQQYMFKAKVDKLKIIRIAGNEAVDFFTKHGLSDIRPTEDDAEKARMSIANGMEPMDVPPGPTYAVNVGEDETGMPIEVPKFLPDENGRGGNLIIEPGDIAGNYDYIPDIESMSPPSPEQVENKLTALIATLTNPAIIQGLAQEGIRPRYKDLIVRAIESTHVVQDAESYFEQIENVEGGVQNGDETNEGGNSEQGGGVQPTEDVQGGGMVESNPTEIGAVNQTIGGGPPQI